MTGGYADWVRQRSAPVAAEKKSKARTPATAGGAAPRQKTSARAKLSFKESRELESLPGSIAALEAEQADITRQLADSALYRDQPARVQALQQRYTQIETELMQCLARWEELEARQPPES